jgi:putative spermidine/putrescine transport system substrate-binding protein
VRFKHLTETGKVPQELQDTLPPAAAYDGAVFLSPDEQATAGGTVSEQWGTTVGAEVTR